MIAKHRHFALVAILLLALLVRLNGILAQSFWIDEGFTWNLTQYSDIFAILRQDVHPPLYFLLMDLWVELAGTSLLSMRYFSVLPGLLSVAVVYHLAREIGLQRGQINPAVPLIAALIMAVAESETFLAQEARSYTWHVLFVSGSMLGFLRWYRTASWRALGLWVFATVALIYTFYLGAFAGVAQGLYLLLFGRRKQQLIGIATLSLCALMLLPWLLLTGSEQTGNISRAEWIRPDAFSFWLDDFRTKYFTGQWALMFALTVAGLFTVDKLAPRLHRTGILLLLWLGVPLLLTLALNELAPTYQPRRVSQIVPAISLLVALGIGHLSGRLRWIVVLILVVYGTFSTDFWRYKQPWREMVADTVPYIKAGVPMLFELGGDDYAPRYHYGDALPASHDFLLDAGAPVDEANVLIGLTTWRHLQPERYASELPAIIDSQDHWWFFYWSSDTGALQWLDTFGFQRSAELTVDFNPDVFLYRYDRTPQSPRATFANGMQLQDATLHDDLTVELLWSTAQSLDADYTISAVIVNEAGQVVAQHDSAPFLGQYPTTTWQPGQLVYDYKPIVLEQPLSGSVYQVGVVVYQISAGEILRVPLAGSTQDDMLWIGEIN